MNVVIVFTLFVGLGAAAPQGQGEGLLRSLSTTRALNSDRLGIYHGKKTTFAKHNYTVAVLIQGEFNCAGSILTDSYVLTTADCVYQTGASDVKVIAGSNDGLTGIIFEVKKIITHPSYIVGIFDYDFSLIKIKGSFSWNSTFGHISLPSADPKPNTVLTVAGWGATSPASGSTNGSSMYQGNMKWVAKATCQKVFDVASVIVSDRMGCTYNKGKTTLCYNDFGDAFVKDGKIYGIMLAGLKSGWCTAKAMPVLIADVYSVVPWINQHIKS